MVSGMMEKLDQRRRGSTREAAARKT